MTAIHELTNTPTGDTPRLDRTPVAELDHVTFEVDGTTILHPTSFRLWPGEVVGIAGGSGAGKTTLLETTAGVRAPSDGRAVRAARSAFVPQDDIIHRELPLRRTLLHSAALRIAEVDANERALIVDRVIEQLDLTEQADVRVADLSGGQRKRASIAAEMLTNPNLFFLDEPTSGLDPANAADFLRSLRALASTGSTVVLSTHAPADLAHCDRVVFVGRGGHVAFIGTPDEALTFFGVESLTEIYERLDHEQAWPECPGLAHRCGPLDPEVIGAADPEWTAPSPTQQLIGLVRRNVDLIRSNRLTLGILVGSPVFIVSMMTALFPSGAFAADAESASLAIQTLFWLAFNSFFFGLTYGLLQIVGEFEIVRRERRNGLGMGVYVASKLVVLVPMLAVVNIGQLVAMEAAGRLPDLSAGDRVAVFVSLQLLSTAAVAIGLHASAAVRDPGQATLALPMLCFPQVLFAGAVVPVSEMGWFAEAMSKPLAVRWGFEPLGRILDLGPAAANEDGTAAFAEAFSGSAAVGWAVLAMLIAVGCGATVHTLVRRTGPAAH